MAGLLFISSSNMNKRNRTLIVSTLIVFLSLLGVDYIVGKVGDYVMTIIPKDATESGLSKDNFRLNHVMADVVIVGSSRGCHHYVSEVLRDSITHFTGVEYSIFNCAIGGKFINSNSCAAESIMDRYTPKLLIFEVSEEELSGANSIKDMEFSAVNYNNNRFVKQYLDALGLEERVKMLSSMYRFNRKALFIVASFNKKSKGSLGYQPLNKKMTIHQKHNALREDSHRDIDKYSLNNFTRVLQTAQDKEIPLIIVSSPKFAPADNNEFLAKTCRQFGVPYIELYNLELFNHHPEYFQDVRHLNDDGAHVYTELFFETLKPYLTPLME